MPKLRFKKVLHSTDLFSDEEEILIGWRQTSVTPYKANTYIINKESLDILKSSPRSNIYLNIRTNKFVQSKKARDVDLYPIKLSFFDILPDYEFKF